MMKICFLNINAYSLFNPKSEAPIGGTEVQLFNLANYLQNKSSSEIFFIVGDWGQEKTEMHKGIKIVKSISLQRTWWNYLKAPFLIWWKLYLTGVDVYIVSSAGIEIGLVAIFCKIFGKKFIYRTAHQMDCDGSFIKKNGWIGKMFQYGLKNANVVVTQNKEHQKMLTKQGIESVVVKNGYVVRNKNFQFGDKKYILWVARCDKWKRPELFLKIVKKFPSQQFLMIAPRAKHEKSLFDKISKQAQELDNLKFIERVDFFKIQKYFDEAKLFLGTSDYEGFPNTYLQACMGGTPIVSLNVNPDEFITKNNLGYCAGGDFDLMLGQIKKLLDNKKLRLEKSKNALKYVKENHDIKKTGERWIKLIEQIKQSN